MASVTTSEFVKTTSHLEVPPFSLIEEKGLVSRLVEEFARAWGELAQDPRGFVRAIFADDTKDAKRSSRIRISLASALAAHIVVIALIAFLGWRHLVQPKKEEANNLKVDMVLPTKSIDEPEAAIPHGKNDAGGGGGGSQSNLPATKGVLPKMSPAPQIVQPLVIPAAMPVLPVSPTIKGAEGQPPPSGVAIGIPAGALSDLPSPGPGTGDGIGGKNGSGAGPGDGPGGGSGGGGNKGTNPEGNSGSPDAASAAPSVVDWRTPPKSGYTSFSWIYQARAIVTPEAQQYKAVGTVLLRATFHSDGRITDIRVVNPVPYMTEAAVEALERSKFRPATINGKPITLTNVLIRQEVHY